MDNSNKIKNLTIRMREDEIEKLKEFAKQNNIKNVSEVVRKTVLSAQLNYIATDNEFVKFSAMSRLLYGINNMNINYNPYNMLKEGNYNNEQISKALESEELKVIVKEVLNILNQEVLTGNELDRDTFELIKNIFINSMERR